MLLIALPLVLSAVNKPIEYPDPNKELARMFYSVPYYTLQRCVIDTARAHAIYSYIIANLSTPGFDFVQYLPAADKARLREAVGSSTELDLALGHEFVMSRFNENSKRYTACITMWKGKKDSLNMIVTLGK